MYKEAIEKQVVEIQKKYRKELLVYREAVLRTPRPPNLHNLRTILTNGTRLRHIEGFLGIKPVVPVTNVFELLSNMNIHVVSFDESKTKRANCVVRNVKMYNHYCRFSESREMAEDLMLQKKYCIEIDIATKGPGYFGKNFKSLFRMSRAYILEHRPELTYDVDEYPFMSIIHCFTDDNGNIIKFEETQIIFLQ